MRGTVNRPRGRCRCAPRPAARLAHRCTSKARLRRHAVQWSSPSRRIVRRCRTDDGTPAFWTCRSRANAGASPSYPARLILPRTTGASGRRALCRSLGSCARTADALEIVQSDEHVPGLRAIRRSEHTRGMELVDDARRSSIADLQAALQQRCRSLLMLHHDFGRLAEEFVAIADVRGLTLLARLDGFALPNLRDDVVLGLRGLLEDEALRGERGALRYATLVIP